MKPKELDKKSSKKGLKNASTELEQRVQDLTADLQRVQADFMNYKRRTQEEQEQIMSIAKEAVILRLLPLVDNLERGLGHLPKGLANNAWAKGVSQVAKQTETVLEDLEVEKISALGQLFNPRWHEAVGYEAGDAGNDVVTEELRTGYKIGNRVIRPAMVKVGNNSAQPEIKNQVIM